MREMTIYHPTSITPNPMNMPQGAKRRVAQVLVVAFEKVGFVSPHLGEIGVGKSEIGQLFHQRLDFSPMELLKTRASRLSASAPSWARSCHRTAPRCWRGWYRSTVWKARRKCSLARFRSPGAPCLIRTLCFGRLQPQRQAGVKKLSVSVLPFTL